MEDLICPVCSEEFEGGMREPLVLPQCGHTFCRPCLLNLQDTDPAFKCPTCRKPHSGPSVDKLPVVYVILNMLATYNYLKVEAGVIWEKCQSHGDPIRLWCQPCQEPLCGQCLFEEHMTDGHNVLRTQTALDQEKQVLMSQAACITKIIEDKRKQLTGEFQEVSLHLAKIYKQATILSHYSKTISDILRTTKETNQMKTLIMNHRMIDNLLEKLQARGCNSRISDQAVKTVPEATLPGEEKNAHGTYKNTSELTITKVCGHESDVEDDGSNLCQAGRQEPDVNLHNRSECQMNQGNEFNPKESQDNEYDPQVSQDDGCDQRVSQDNGHDPKENQDNEYDLQVSQDNGCDPQVSQDDVHDPQVSWGEGCDPQVSQDKGRDSQVSQDDEHELQVSQDDGHDPQVSQDDGHDLQVSQDDGHDPQIRQNQGDEDGVKPSEDFKCPMWQLSRCAPGGTTCWPKISWYDFMAKLPVVQLLVPPEKPEVFLQLGVGERNLGRVHICLWGHLRRAQHFLALCLGTLGPSYKGSTFSYVARKGEPGERLVGGVYLTEDGGSSSHQLIQGLEWRGEYLGPASEGTIGGSRGRQAKYNSCFCISSRDNPIGQYYCPFGKVVSGLGVVRAAIQHDPVSDVTITDAGLVVPST
ncbi:uncharacterized protein [Panulirus ornatus]|uniref:uncharacterized protein n=1 Tax=Panulirus ornatus TaxID=150431 RepID=UPI003A8B37EC